MSDNAPAKVVTVQPGHYDEPVLYTILYKVNANSKKLFVLLELHSSFWLQYRLMTVVQVIPNSVLQWYMYVALFWFLLG